MSKKNIFRDAFGNWYFLKRFFIFLFGSLTYRRFNGFNKLKLSGTEYLADLPDSNILIVSNHQTYFADVFAMFHVFCSVKNGYIDSIQNPIYLLNPKIDLYFIAAEETMNKGILPKLFKFAGAITVKRTWRAEGKDVNRLVDMKEINNIEKALDSGWVIAFPQGTTSAFAPGRKGTARLVKQHKPIVIPVVIDGFRRAFDKKGILIKKKGIEPSMTFKAPLDIDYENEDTASIMKKIMTAIEQTEDFLKVKPLEKEDNQPKQFFY